MIKTWHQLSWRKKNRALLVGSVLFALVTYHLAVKNTIELRRNYLSNREESLLKAQTESKILQLETQLANYTSAESGTSGVLLSEKEYLVGLAHDLKVKVTNLSETISISDESSSTDYNAYYFSGPFIELLMFLDQMEKEERMNLLNVSFFKQKNNSTQRSELIMKIETAKITAN